MDPRLAELYGTTQQTDDGDLEKAAAAEFAEGLTEEGEMSLDGLTEDDLEALAQEVLSEDASGAEVEEPAEEGEVAFSEEEQEKLAEADFVGRAMAHAYVAELREIEKDAGAVGDFVKKHGKKAGDAVKKGYHYVAGKAKALHEHRKSHVTRAGKRVKSVFTKTDPSGRPWQSKMDRLRTLGGAAKDAAPELAAAGAGAGALALRKKGKEKKASALDTLVEQRALEMLAASGIPVESSEKTAATQYDVLADVVEQKAMELLAANGYELVETDEE